MSHTSRPRIVYTDHCALTGEDLTAFESLIAAQRVARGSGHDDNWELVLASEGSDANGWRHTTGVFRPAPDDRLTRPVPLGYVEMSFSKDGQALPDSPVGDERRRTIAALTRTTGAPLATTTEHGPATAATADPQARRTR